MKVLIYDCEIKNCIPPRDGRLNPDLTYAKSWSDHKGMGISLIGTWQSWDNSIRIYPESSFSSFQKAVMTADLVVGFNSIGFDDKLCQANGLFVKTDYDLLAEVWYVAGMPRQYTYGKTRAGYKLDDIAKANFGKGKSGSGELAPELWQKGKHWSVVTYLTDDILITKKLWQNRHSLIDPTNGSKLVLQEPCSLELVY